MNDADRFDLFARLRERVGDSFQQALSDGIASLADTALSASSGPAPTDAPVPGMAAAARTLRSEAASRARHGRSVLHDLTYRLLELNQTGTRPDDSSLLSLLPAHGLDLQILADELANAIRESCGLSYAQWLNRIDALTGIAASETRAPFGASAVSAAVLEALQPYAADPSLRCDLRNALLERFAPRMAGVLLDAHAWLGSALGQGSLTFASAGARSPPPSPDARPIPSGTSQDGPGRGLTDALAGSLTLAHSLGSSALSPGGPSDAPVVRVFALPRAHEFEHDAVRFAREQGVEPFGRQARQRYFIAPRRRMQQLGATPGQLAALDLVAGLFDCLCEDARLPAAARPLLWRLQHPVAVLATLDAGFLADDPRSVRRLVEAVVGFAVSHRDDVARHGEVYRRLENSVRAVEVMAHALQSRSSVLAERVRHEFRRAEQGVTTLISQLARDRETSGLPPDRRNRRNLARRPSAQTEQAVTQRLELLLRQRLARCEVPESVQEFLLAVWLRHLRTAVLRDGEHSESFRQALQVVDDLLWTLDAQAPGLTRRQLAQRIPPLIQALTQGVAGMGVNQDEYQPFLDALFLMHLRKMQKTPRDRAGESSAGSQTADASPAVWPATQVLPASQVAQGASEPRVAPDGATAESAAVWPEPSAREGQAPGAAAVEVASVPEEPLSAMLASIDLNDLPAHPRRLRIDAQDALGGLRVGDWLEMEGREALPQQVKVAWINPNRTVLLMVRRADRKVVSLRATELLQRFEQHKAVLMV